MIKHLLRFLYPNNSTPIIVLIQKVFGVSPKELSHYIPLESDKSPSSSDFQRLEFLGDAVLGAVVSSHIFRLYPEKNEGALSELKSKIVNRNQLNKIALDIGLNRINSQKPNNHGKDFYGNLLEAIIGAIYLDKGYLVAQEVIIKKILHPELLQSLDQRILSYKNFWTEWGQKEKVKVEFLTEQENSTENFFRCQLTIGNEIKSFGRASSKKKAEEIAAKRAYYQKEKLF